MGSWFIGLDVEHIDDKRLCCGTPPGKPPLLCALPTLSCLIINPSPSRLDNFSCFLNVWKYYIDTKGCTMFSWSHIRYLSLTTDCEWKAQAGNICAASFDWRCSGICNSEGRIWEVHNKCAEGEKALWNATF